MSSGTMHLQQRLPGMCTSHALLHRIRFSSWVWYVVRWLTNAYHRVWVLICVLLEVLQGHPHLSPRGKDFSAVVVYVITMRSKGHDEASHQKKMPHNKRMEGPIRTKIVCLRLSWTS